MVGFKRGGPRANSFYRRNPSAKATGVFPMAPPDFGPLGQRSGSFSFRPPEPHTRSTIRTSCPALSRHLTSAGVRESAIVRAGFYL
jgi:hypothetical protein